MRRLITRFRRSFRYGEKGFTLIELLVVVAILGVLAAVIVPNVARFLGTGLMESANTEAHNVQTAVVAYMADNSLADLGGTLVGPGETEDIGPSVTDGTTVHSFLLNPGGLQAKYTIDDDTGEITDATTVGITNSKWGDLEYDSDVGWHEPE